MQRCGDLQAGPGSRTHHEDRQRHAVVADKILGLCAMCIVQGRGSTGGRASVHKLVRRVLVGAVTPRKHPPAVVTPGGI